MTYRLLTLTLLGLLAGGCAAAKPAPAPSTGLPLEANGQLALVRAVTQLSSDGTTLALTLKNPYLEPVHGVRVVYRVLVSREADAAEVARTQSSFSDTIEPGKEATVSISLPPQAGQAGFGTFVHAFAMRRGDRDMTPPPFWRTEPQ